MEGSHMTVEKPASWMLSPSDAFFVAYQEGSGILMQMGFEVELRGTLGREDLERTLTHLITRWPQLGQKLQQRLFGLAWNSPCQIQEMLRVGEDAAALRQWHNQPMDPFREPPFQVFWIRGEASQILAARAHHSVMDGEALLQVHLEMMNALANLKGGQSPAVPNAVPPATPPGWIESFKPLCSPETWSHLRRMSKEAKAGRSVRLAVRNSTPGPTATCDRLLTPEETKRLMAQAAVHGTQPLWLCTAAWMRAIHAWNRISNPASNPTVSLEFPVSLRRGNVPEECLGNLISPLTLFGDAAQPIGSLANSLKEQFVHAIRKRHHLAMPLVTAPLRFLPWALFRRVVLSPLATGFATSHFTWHEHKRDRFTNISAWSQGRLELVSRRNYTPVCLHMGAALLVVSVNDCLHFSITHRLNALSSDDANRLADLLLAELLPESAGRANSNGN
jgi:hypothetical protein